MIMMYLGYGRGDNLEIVQLLVASGVRLVEKDCMNQTALSYCTLNPQCPAIIYSYLF